MRVRVKTLKSQRKVIDPRKLPNRLFQIKVTREVYLYSENFNCFFPAFINNILQANQSGRNRKNHSDFPQVRTTSFLRLCCLSVNFFPNLLAGIYGFDFPISRDLNASIHGFNSLPLSSIKVGRVCYGSSQPFFFDKVVKSLRMVVRPEFLSPKSEGYFESPRFLFVVNAVNLWTCRMSLFPYFFPPHSLRNLHPSQQPEEVICLISSNCFVWDIGGSSNAL